MKKYLNVLLASVVVFLSACSITPPITETANKAARLSCTTATPGVDGVAVTTCSVDSQEIDKVSGANAGIWKRSIQVFSNLPTGSEVIKGVMGTVPAAATQGLFGLEIAKENAKRCAGGNCGTIIQNLNRNEAGALSNSESAAGAAVGITSGTCKTPSCLAQ